MFFNKPKKVNMPLNSQTKLYIQFFLFFEVVVVVVVVVVSFGVFVWWHINLRGLFNTKAIFIEEQ